jgi:hypothetical protein
MTKMDDFTMEELMIFTVSILGALGGFMVVLQKSKCKSICWGCCIRDVDAVLAEEKLEITGHTGTTPRIPSLALELKKEAREAEPEIESSKN